MAAKKKATKTTAAKSTKAKAHPRQVFVVWNDDPKHDGTIPASATTKKRALELVDDPGEYVIGPFILAERARNR